MIVFFTCFSLFFLVSMAMIEPIYAENTREYVSKLLQETAVWHVIVLYGFWFAGRYK